MSISDRQEALISEFAQNEDWQKRYEKIITLGKTLPPFPEQHRREENKVKGCQSQVWLHAQLNNHGQVVFFADSDAMIVRGLISLLLRIYSEASPDEILQTPPEFIERIGFRNNLSPSRSNGLHAMIKQIKNYAMVFKLMATKPVT